MKTVVLEVRSLQETQDDATRAMKTGRAERDARIGFASPELLWRVLTAKRWELLKAMCGAGPMSIREAARRVGRDVKAVHGDVKALLDAGVLSRNAAGAIEFPFESVKVEFMLTEACRGATPAANLLTARRNREGWSALVAPCARAMPFTSKP